MRQNSSPFAHISKVENHEVAKELLAGFAGAEADKLFETHGLK